VNGATLAVMAARSYRLTVQGELSDSLRGAFPGMELTRTNGNTTLTGDIRDEAELQGLLRRGRDACDCRGSARRGGGLVGTCLCPGSRHTGMVGAPRAIEEW
jgi:hypothetical protein